MQLKYITEDRSMNYLKKLCKINLILGIDANKFFSKNKNVLLVEGNYNLFCI